MRDGGWKPYVPVAVRRAKARNAAAKAKKAGADHAPIEPYHGAIAKTFWGKAWCDNLEHYSDYENRLPRGRTYVRNGSVIDLKISDGEVNALVIGSSLYTVDVDVRSVADAQWQSISADCAGSIDSLVELLQGKLSKAVMARICQPGTGLFPAPTEIEFSCSCPDWASMCKHVAAVLYGVGARLDQQPDLLFRLRGVDAEDLIAQASETLPTAKNSPTSKKRLDDSSLADVFGIEMADAALPVKKKTEAKTKPATDEPAAKTATGKRATIRKPRTSGTTTASKKIKAVTTVKTSVGSRKASVKPVARQAKRTASAPNSGKAKNGRTP